MSDNSVSIFEQASRRKLRFSTAIGLLSIEDLWTLDLTSARSVSLDDVAKGLRRLLKETEDESFVVKASSRSTEVQLSFDIVKHIIDTRLAERDEAKTRADNRERKQKLQSLIAEKQDESLKAASVEELQAMVEAL